MGRKKPARGRENRAGEAVRACNFCNVKQDFMQNRVRMDTWALPSEILWGVASLTRRNPIFFRFCQNGYHFTEGPLAGRACAAGAPISSQRNGGKEGAGGTFPPAPPRTGAHGGGALCPARRDRACIAARLIGTYATGAAAPRAARIGVTLQALEVVALYRSGPPGRRRCHAPERRCCMRWRCGARRLGGPFAGAACGRPLRGRMQHEKIILQIWHTAFSTAGAKTPPFPRGPDGVYWGKRGRGICWTFGWRPFWRCAGWAATPGRRRS